MAVTLTSPATLVAVSQAALRTHACAKRGARSRSGVRAQQGFIFFFQQGSHSEARGQPAAPACQRPQENSPARAGTGHRAEQGRMGSPRRSARVEQQGLTRGGHLAFPGHPSGTQGLFWELAGRRVTGRGALPGGGLSLRAAGSCSAPHPGRTRGFPPAAFRDPTPPSPRSPVLGGAAPHPIPSPSPGSAPAGRIRPRRGTKSKLPGTSSPWLGAVAGGVGEGTPRENGTEGLSLVAFCPFPARWRRGNSGGAAPRSQSPPGGTGPRVNRVRPGAAAAQSAPALVGGDF